MKIENSVINLIVGLGNPGDEYLGTRHNIGREVVGALAERGGAKWTKGPGGKLLWAKGERQRLVIPETFMNLSGGAVRGFVRFFKILPEAMIVVHDDLDLPFGDIRVSMGGSSGGHRGIESIAIELGNDAFWRLRVGIGRPSPVAREPEEISRYVLGKFTENEQQDLSVIVDGAVRLLVGLDETAPEAETLHLLESEA